jgi:uncharacterized protein (DUF433 family)
VPVLTAAHIRLDDRDVAWIDDTNTKVIEVALDMIVHGWSPAEIHFQHPHLSLAQIHAALGHYYDHQAGLDEQIDHSAREAGRLRTRPVNLPSASGFGTWAGWRECQALHGRAMCPPPLRADS